MSTSIVPVRRVLVVSLLAAALLPVTAQTVPSPSGFERSIMVVGEGVIRTEPDMAVVRIGVETFGTDMQETLDENRRRMNSLLEALVAAGIDRRNIQTAFYNVSYERFPPPQEGPPAEPPAGNYRVSNMLSVIARELERLGTILDSAVDAGANQIWGIEFTVSEPERLAEQARVQAVNHARRKAMQLAALAGVQLGRVQSLNEVIGQPGVGPFHDRMEGLGGETPIVPGEITFRVQIQVTYLIE